jgi:hypothetical protein
MSMTGYLPANRKLLNPCHRSVLSFTEARRFLSGGSSIQFRGLSLTDCPHPPLSELCSCSYQRRSKKGYTFCPHPLLSELCSCRPIVRRINKGHHLLAVHVRHCQVFVCIYIIRRFNEEIHLHPIHIRRCQIRVRVAIIRPFNKEHHLPPVHIHIAWSQ